MNILEYGNNKTKCQHFTPDDIAMSMLDLADYRDNLIGKAVLENSFGSGNILKAIVKRYDEALAKLGQAITTLRSKRNRTFI